MPHFNYTVPSDAAKYILFQRTQYLAFAGSRAARVVRRIAPPLSYNRMVALEARLRKRQIAELYLADMEREYKAIRAHLPEHCEHLLDIGCGIAGIDVFVSAHYDHNTQVTLLDKSAVADEVFYMFKTRGAFYNSLDLAKRMLVSNGVPKESVTLLEATDDNQVNVEGPLDLVLSIISWGYHYPVNTYISSVHALLREGGVLIMDIRKGSNGIEEVDALFAEVDVISEDPVSHRIRAVK